MSTALVEAVSMDAAEYFASPGLSNSGMKDLAVSTMRYWWLNINPDRPAEESTPALRFGSALHCAVLEPTEFEHRYCCEVDVDQYPGILDTVEEMKAFIRLNDRIPKGTRKADFIAQVQAISENQPILETIEAEHAKIHAGKIMFKLADWQRVNSAADALLGEPAVQRILEKGEPEVSYFVTDPDTGVRLKARMDWTTPTETTDFKTFTQMRGKSIDQSVADALYYEGYLRQAEFYGMIRQIASGNRSPMTFPFVESDAPHEVRIKRVMPGTHDLHSAIPRAEIRGLINLYADCVKRFGDRPWRDRQSVERLTDEDVKQFSY